MEDKAIVEFVENAIYRLDESMRMITIAFQELNEDDVWYRFNGSSNSVGNLILHLCGNITQYAIASLGELPDNRERDLEFSTENTFTKNELLEKLNAVVNQAKATIIATNSNNWLKKREVQGFNFSGIGVVLHVVEHFSYHTGQIAFYAKQIKNKQLGFYDGFNLNTINGDV